MRVHWTDNAKLRLNLIKNYIADDNPKAARKTVRKILLRSQQISELPRSGRRVPEYNQEDIREILERPFRIIYRIKPDQIDVLTVMHYRRLLPQDIREI